MKTSVSIPEKLFRAAERLAMKKGVSRSELYAEALELLLKRERARDPGVQRRITAKLNEVYSDDDEVFTMSSIPFKMDSW